jgi:8-oxo-dGTP pyrophosphatase MutT (NUDIX family)
MSVQQPVPAATVVLVRECPGQGGLEVLLLRRNAELVFYGGHWVFPGGRIDAEDFARSGSALEYPAALQAAVRETREEAGINIDASALIHIAHWTTPPQLPRRFSTWFFLCPLLESVQVTVDRHEILEHRWISPQAALAQAEARTLELPRPTRATLEGLVAYRQLAGLLAVVTESNIRVYPENSQYYKPLEMGYS